MKITYIYHSGFMVEMEEVTLLFDYYKGLVPQANANKPMIVFVSHAHHDHFNKAIFNLRQHFQDVTYILSSDIRRDVTGDSKDKLYRMDANEQVAIRLDTGELKIRTLDSTDVGVAFLIDINGKTIYHAGDLHWWSWIGEQEQDNEDMENRFKNEMKKIGGMKVDVAFIPLDLRLKDRFWWGFDHFMRTTNTLHAFPMHFWKDFSVVAKLKDMDVSKPYRDRIKDIKKEGQEFLIP